MGEFTITLSSGLSFDFSNPQPNQFTLSDIIQGLEGQKRYSNQTKYPYSVLRHSLLVCYLCPKEYRLEGLFHDAQEAFCSDITGPLKRYMRKLAADYGDASVYDLMENRIEVIIRKKYKLDGSFEVQKLVREADKKAYCLEYPRLFDILEEGWDSNFSFEFTQEETNKADIIIYLHVSPDSIIRSMFLGSAVSLLKERGINALMEPSENEDEG